MRNGPLTEGTMDNKVPSWDNIIHTLGEQKHMFLALLKEAKKPAQSIHSWAARELDGGAYGGKLDTEPAGSAKGRSYGSLSNATEENESIWKVTARAGVTDTVGIASAQQKVEEKAAAINRLKNGLEMLFLSEQDASVQSGETPFRCRGIGKVLANSGHSAAFPIAEEFRVSSDCIHTGALDTLTEEAFEALLAAASIDVENSVTLDGFVGPLLKRQMDLFGARDPAATTTNMPMRQFTQSGRDGEFVSMIDVFKFSVGLVRTHINHRLFRDVSGARTDVISSAGGYFLDMARNKIAFQKKIAHMDLNNDGSGDTGVYSYIATLLYGIPKGQLMVRPSSLTT